MTAFCNHFIRVDLCDVCSPIKDPRDAEIARLKAEVEQLRESEADLIQWIFDGGQRAGIEPADLSPTEVLTRMADDLAALKAEVERLTGLLDDADQVTRDALGHARAGWEGERERLTRALAAGPAALRATHPHLAGMVEDAQEAAMKEWK